MNIAGISGRLTAEPELKKTQNGKSVCQATIAVKRPRTKDTTDFLTVVLWNQNAEYLCRYAHKGDLVEVQGSITTRKYQDKNGQSRTAFEISADNVSLQASKAEKQGNNNMQNDSFSNIEDFAADADFPF